MEDSSAAEAAQACWQALQPEQPSAPADVPAMARAIGELAARSPARHDPMRQSCRDLMAEWARQRFATGAWEAVERARSERRQAGSLIAPCCCASGVAVTDPPERGPRPC